MAGEGVGRCGPGLCIYLAIGKGDTENDVRSMVDKVKGLRIFEDGQGKMNRSLTEVGGEILLVSEFTLYGNCKKGRRPSFSEAASPEEAEPLYRCFEQKLRDSGLKVATGIFQAKMEVSTTNDGPLTFILESKDNRARFV